MYKVIIKVNNTIIEPVVREPVTWTTNWQGVPGTLTLSIISPGIKIPKGTEIQFWDNDEKLFFGYIFETKNKKDKIISITAYDQLRYLKNKDNRVFTNMTATEIIKKIADDTYMRCGTLEDSGYKIASMIKKSSYFDMILDAISKTNMNTRNLYILDDDFGKLRLRNIANTAVGILLDEESAQDYSYSSSIDSDTYNQIKVVREDKEKKTKSVFIAKDSSNIQNWGLLQLLEDLDEKENGQVKADTLLKLKNRETKRFSLSKCFGDNKLRAGNRCYVKLKTEEETIDSMMLIEKAKHQYYKDAHFMDLEFVSGVFS